MLILQNGKKFNGISIGSQGVKTGLVVLYTGVVGYQEVITDPANIGKIIVMTYPLIGNYGTNPKFNQSKNARCAGIIIKENSRISSNWQAKDDFSVFLKKEKVICLSEVDTRTLAVDIREEGEQLGIISDNNIKSPVFQKVRSYLKEISVNKITNVFKGKGAKIAIIDIGVTNSLLWQLEKLNLDIWLVPYNIDAGELLKLKPNGIIIPNGPEEDSDLHIVENTIKNILGKIRILGISTGHLAIAKALGYKVKKMKTGHRGVNYPVISEGSFKGDITVQNHGYVIDENSLDKNVKIAERNLNDKTIEKIYSNKLDFVSIQYCPESPGNGEINSVFNEFLKTKVKI